jgi:predicted nucleic acid-binding protein
MIILDSDVVSALMRLRPEEPVTQWLDRQPASSIWITSITVMEIKYGLQTMPKGIRQVALARSFELLLNEKIERRIAPFDTEAAQHAADLMSLRKARGRPGDTKDTMIAGIALASHATLATRNTSHFEDLPISVVNPWMA